MSKLKQCIYTLILLVTCVVASPFIYKQIWESSNIKKPKAAVKEPTAVTQSTDGTTTAAQEGATTETQTTSEGEEATTEAPTEPTTPQSIFVESGPEYFDDALFIGDSRTVGISSYGTLKNADYFCDIGLSVYKIDDYNVGGMTVWDKLRKKQYAKIYVMLGINEIGNDLEGTTAKYRRLVDGIREIQKDALIYLQANLHVSTEGETQYITNERINILNSNLQAMADASKKIYYLDVNPIFDDANGYLTSEFASDGVHVLARYYATWCDWLCKNTVPATPVATTNPTDGKTQTETTTTEAGTTTQNKKPQNEEFSNL